MKKIKKVSALSVGKTMGVTYAFLGLLIGAAITIVALLSTHINSSPKNFFWGGTTFRVFAIIFFPIFYGVLGFVFGTVGGWFYNLASKISGGIRVEIDDENSFVPPQM